MPIYIFKNTKTNKTYEFTIKWGQQTSTDDIEGEIIKSSNKIPTKNEILNKKEKLKKI